MISIITPWLNAPELLTLYEQSTRGAQPVIVDNGSDEATARLLVAFARRAGGIYLRNETNLGYARANNQGLAAATGDIIVFMNNDVKCQPGFLKQVEADIKDAALYGPSLLSKHGWDYLEGFCIGAFRWVWDALSGWDDTYYTGLYWDDNDICFRAQMNNYKLVKTTWPVWHHGNYTSSRTPGAYDHSAENEAKFLERIKTWRH